MSRYVFPPIHIWVTLIGKQCEIAYCYFSWFSTSTKSSSYFLNYFFYKDMDFLTSKKYYILYLTGSNFAPNPQGTFDNVWRYFDSQNWWVGVTGKWQAEAKDTAKHLTMYKMAPQNQDSSNTKMSTVLKLRTLRSKEDDI